MSAWDHDQQSRWLATTKTWLQKTTWLLQDNAEQHGHLDYVDHFVERDVESLMDSLLEAMAHLAPLLPLDQEFDYEAVESARKQLNEITADLRRRVLAEKLADTTGRNDVEAEAFRRKAEELRA
jgi:hypothetical protein